MVLLGKAVGSRSLKEPDSLRIGMDKSQLGRAGELAIELYALITAAGALDIYSPVVDDDHVDLVAGVRGGQPTLGIQVKATDSLDRGGLVEARAVAERCSSSALHLCETTSSRRSASIQCSSAPRCWRGLPNRPSLQSGFSPWPDTSSVEFDHVLIAVPDLASAGQELEARHGLASVEGGRHPAWGTANRIVPLGDSYLAVSGDGSRPAWPAPFGRLVGRSARISWTRLPDGWMYRLTLGRGLRPMESSCAGAPPELIRQPPNLRFRSSSNGRPEQRSQEARPCAIPLVWPESADSYCTQTPGD